MTEPFSHIYLIGGMSDRPGLVGTSRRGVDDPACVEDRPPPVDYAVRATIPEFSPLPRNIGRSMNIMWQVLDRTVWSAIYWAAALRGFMMIGQSGHFL